MAALKEIGKGKNYILYSDGKQKLIKFMNVRASFPFFGTPREEEPEDEDGGPTRKRITRGGQILVNKETHAEAVEALKVLFRELLKANSKDPANPIKVPAEYRALKDGDEKDDPSGILAGHWVISFSEGAVRNGKPVPRPACRNVHGELIDDVEKVDEMFYGGCWINVLLRPWFFNGKAKSNPSKTFPKRLICGYNGVQHVKDDQAFGNGRINDEAAWGDESDDDGDGMGSSPSKKIVYDDDDDDI